MSEFVFCWIVSDQTPWQADEKGAVEIIPLSEPDLYVAAIEHWASLDRFELSRYRIAAIEYLNKYRVSEDEVQKMNRKLFDVALQRGK